MTLAAETGALGPDQKLEKKTKYFTCSYTPSSDAKPFDLRRLRLLEKPP